MVVERPARRMTLRQLLTHSEKCARDLIEHFQGTLMPTAADFRDLSRPVRRRSHYPAMLAMMNALNKLQHVGEETEALIQYLSERLQEIRQHAQHERSNRR